MGSFAELGNITKAEVVYSVFSRDSGDNEDTGRERCNAGKSVGIGPHLHP